MNEYDNMVKAYADEILTIDQLNKLEECEMVEAVKNCGNSGRFSGCTLYNVKLVNGDEFSVYTR